MLQLARSLRLSKIVINRIYYSTKSPIRGVIEQPVNTSIFEPYDVIVVGGGHAGCEGK